MNKPTPAEVFPPGEILRDELDARGWTQDVLADILDRPVAVISRIITGKTRITPETAHGLGDALGTGAQFWLNLESAYQLFLARQKADVTNRVARKAKLYSKAPVREMIRRGWIGGSENIEVLEAQVCEFLRIGSLDKEPRLTAAARKSTEYGEHSVEQMAWMCRARNIAPSVHAADYKQSSCVSRLDELRTLATDVDNVRQVPRCLADLGIRLVIVEPLPRTKIDGACFWLSERSEPVIVLSMRYDRIDYFWYTLAHEIGHVVKGHALSVDSELVGSEPPDDAIPKQEEEANEFAVEFLVPQDDLDDFIQRTKPLYSRTKIAGFAAVNKIHPGIVIGQLQHRKEISYSHSRDKLEKIRSIITRTALTDGWGNEVGA